MKTTIQSVNFKASSSLKEFTNKKIKKLFIQNESIIRADVTLYEGEKKSTKNQYCEIRLVIKGNDHFIKKNSESLEKSISTSVDGLLKIMRRKKVQKITARKSKKAI